MQTQTQGFAKFSGPNGEEVWIARHQINTFKALGPDLTMVYANSPDPYYVKGSCSSLVGEHNRWLTDNASWLQTQQQNVPINSRGTQLAGATGASGGSS